MMDHENNRLPVLSGQEKRDLLSRLLRGRLAASVVDHPLSYNQRSLWFMHCLAPDSAAYNVPFVFRILPPLDNTKCWDKKDMLKKKCAAAMQQAGTL